MLEALAEGDAEPNALANGLSSRFPLADVRDAVEDLLNAHAIKVVDLPKPLAIPAPGAPKARKRIPLTTLDSSDIRSVHLGSEPKVLLRDPTLAPERPHD